jgi:ribosomal protein S18 acetylase RimI-like enzyme
MEVLLARFEHLEEVSNLFDLYRIFYKQPSDLGAARNFLQERFQKNDSTIFVVSNNGCLIGFTQLYPSFSSVSMKCIWILNDLFVKEPYRNQGAAKLLLSAAADFARETEAVRIILATQTSNTAAQALYESLGFAKDYEFDHYALRV